MTAAPSSHRPTIAVTQHAISAGHYLAATAGFDILQAGGNAIDAGLRRRHRARRIAERLVDVAGVAPIMIYLAEKQEVVTIAGLGTWPKALDPRALHARARRQDPEGRVAHRRAGGARRLDHGAAALRHDELWRGRGGGDPLGARRLPDVPADGREPQAARGGSSRLAVDRGDLSAERAAARNRRACSARPISRRRCNTWPTRSARPRSRGREAGLEAARDAFYRGDIARKIVAFMKQEGGLLSAEDLAEYHSPVGPPERRRFGDLEVFTCGAWCQGPVLLQTLASSRAPISPALGHNSADYVHTLTEALKLAFADREAYYGDPAFVEVPLADPDLVGICRRAQQADPPDRAWPEMPPPGELGRAWRSAGGPARRPQPRARHLLCLRRRPQGNLFSATPSDGSYGTPVVPGTGLIPS